MQKIVANFTSQTWLPNEDWKLNHTGGKTWWHWLTIFVPLESQKNYKKELADTAILIIAGGSNNDNPGGQGADAEAAHLLAKNTGSVVVLLNQIPNGSVKFAEDGGRSRSGKASWQNFCQKMRNC